MLQSCEGRQVEIVIPHRREFSSEGLHKLERCHQGESCDFHKSTTAALASRIDAADMLSKQAATEKQHNRLYLLKVSSSILFLACQGLPLHGDGHVTRPILTFISCYFFGGEDYSAINQFLERQQLKYTVHEVQNKLLFIMALQILCHIAAQIQSAVFFTVMLDETTDCSNKEQTMLVFKWVDDDVTAHEEFIGLYLTDSITVAALVAII